MTFEHDQVDEAYERARDDGKLPKPVPRVMDIGEPGTLRRRLMAILEDLPACVLDAKPSPAISDQVVYFRFADVSPALYDWFKEQGPERNKALAGVNCKCGGAEIRIVVFDWFEEAGERTITVPTMQARPRPEEAK